ncbi:MAG: hypothetical protein QOD71_1001 [Thermoleophilaceae bacterium]|nr:hypothetical protein [Thermoleophilaceae bacterium]
MTIALLASLGDWKTVSDIASNVVTAVAVAVGASWAYWRFVRERTRWPRAELELVVTHREMTVEHTLLNATVKIKNVGAGLMKLSGIRAYVYRILPLDEETERRLTNPAFFSMENGGDWPCIGSFHPQWGERRQPEVETSQNSQRELQKPEREPRKEPEIEPQEHEEFGWDFIVPSSTETVFVYVYVTNVKKQRANRELGWQVTAFYDLTEQATERRVSNVTMGDTISGSRALRQEQRPPSRRPRREREEKQREPRPDPAPQPQREPRPDPPPPPQPPPATPPREPRRH